MSNSKVITISIVKTQECKKVIDYKEKKVTILCNNTKHTSNVIVRGNSAFYFTQEGKLAYLARPGVEVSVEEEEIIIIRSKWFEPLTLRVITPSRVERLTIEPGEEETILIERPFTRVVVTSRGKVIYEETFARNVFWECKREGLVARARVYGRNVYYDNFLVLCNNKTILQLSKGESVDKVVECFGRLKFVNSTQGEHLLLDEC